MEMIDGKLNLEFEQNGDEVKIEVANDMMDSIVNNLETFGKILTSRDRIEHEYLIEQLIPPGSLSQENEKSVEDELLQLIKSVTSEDFGESF